MSSYLVQDTDLDHLADGKTSKADIQKILGMSG